jgi:hypothetical protein
LTKSSHKGLTSSLPRIRRGHFVGTSNSPLLRAELVQAPRLSARVSRTAESAVSGMKLDVAFSNVPHCYRSQSPLAVLDDVCSVRSRFSIRTSVYSRLFINARSNALGSMLCLSVNASRHPSAPNAMLYSHFSSLSLSSIGEGAVLVAISSAAFFSFNNAASVQLCIPVFITT